MSFFKHFQLPAAQRLLLGALALGLLALAVPDRASAVTFTSTSKYCIYLGGCGTVYELTLQDKKPRGR